MHTSVSGCISTEDYLTDRQAGRPADALLLLRWSLFKGARRNLSYDGLFGSNVNVAAEIWDAIFWREQVEMMSLCGNTLSQKSWEVFKVFMEENPSWLWMSQHGRTSPQLLHHVAVWVLHDKGRRNKQIVEDEGCFVYTNTQKVWNTRNDKHSNA